MAELQEAEIRARIKRARKEAGLSQPEMAELLEVIPRTVQNYENDHVPWGRIRDIAEITGQSTRWLLHGDVGPASDDGEPPVILSRLDQIDAALQELRDQQRETRTGLATDREAITKALKVVADQMAEVTRRMPKRPAA